LLLLSLRVLITSLFPTIMAGPTKFVTSFWYRTRLRRVHCTRYLLHIHTYVHLYILLI